MNNIISNIWYLYKWLAFKRTVQFCLIVAHRIDTLRICDKIYKVENNKITETLI